MITYVSRAWSHDSASSGVRASLINGGLPSKATRLTTAAFVVFVVMTTVEEVTVVTETSEIVKTVDAVGIVENEVFVTVVSVRDKVEVSVKMVLVLVT